MNNEQKAKEYERLMFEYTRIQNRISSIKGESINLNEIQLRQVKELETQLRHIIESASKL